MNNDDNNSDNDNIRFVRHQSHLKSNAQRPPLHKTKHNSCFYTKVPISRIQLFKKKKEAK